MLVPSSACTIRGRTSLMTCSQSRASNKSATLSGVYSYHRGHPRTPQVLTVTQTDTGGVHVNEESIVAASALLRDELGRVLLIRRVREPARNLWSLPGGRVLPRESPREAASREVFEETGLTVSIGKELWSVTVQLSHKVQYLIHGFEAAVLGGTLCAGDDAAEARWVTPKEYRSLDTTPRLTELLAAAGWPTPL